MMWIYTASQFLLLINMLYTQSAMLLWQSRPSACPSHSGIAYIIKLFPPSDKGMNLVFLSATAVTKLRGKLRQLGATLGCETGFSMEIAVYLRKGTR